MFETNEKKLILLGICVVGFFLGRLCRSLVTIDS